MEYVRGHDWHQMGRRCITCGYLAVPSRFYEGRPVMEGDREKESHAKAEVLYLEWCRDNDWNPEFVPTNVPTNGMSLQGVPTCEECGEKPREGRYKLCSGCRKAKVRAGN